MKGTPISEEIYDYIVDLFPVEDDLLRQLRHDAIEAEIPPIQISPEQGRFMQVMLRGMGAGKIIEVGTLGGYSAIIMGRALPEDGRLVTIERDPFRAEFARQQIRKAGLDGKIEVKVGDGGDVLERELAGSGPYDFAFIDADKPGYTRYLELIIPMMRTGGLIVADNALSRGRVIDSRTDDPDVRGIQEYNRAVATHPGLVGSLVAVGDGMCIAAVL